TLATAGTQVFRSSICAGCAEELNVEPCGGSQFKFLYDIAAVWGKLPAHLCFDVPLAPADPGQGSDLHRQEGEQIVDGDNADHATSLIHDAQRATALVAHHVYAQR